jgi:hypothetical protein
MQLPQRLLMASQLNLSQNPVYNLTNSGYFTIATTNINNQRYITFGQPAASQNALLLNGGLGTLEYPSSGHFTIAETDTGGVLLWGTNSLNFYIGITNNTYPQGHSAFTIIKSGTVMVTDGTYGAIKNNDYGNESFAVGGMLFVNNGGNGSQSNILGAPTFTGALTVTNGGGLSVAGITSFTGSQFTNGSPFNYSNNWLTATNSRKTNLSRRGTWEVDFTFKDQVAAGPIARITVEDSTAFTNTFTVSVPIGVVSTLTNHFSFKVGPSGVVSVTNASAATADIVIGANWMVWD